MFACSGHLYSMVHQHVHWHVGSDLELYAQSFSLQSEDPGEPISVLLPLPKPDANPDSLKEQPGVVEWKPPHIDWDPWTFRSAFQEGGRYSQLEPVSVSVRL